MKRLIHGLLIIGVIIVSSVWLRGYAMYQAAYELLPLEDMVEQVKEDENYVSILEVSPIFLDAIVSVEDKRFYHHNGVDPIAIARATYQNVKALDLVAGGSTITQQLAKNMYFSFEKRFDRKVAEVLVARDLEKKYNKTEILELYINIIYYGDGFTGINEASMGYFEKDASELTTEEAILLAGLPQAPSYYGLKSNYNRAIARSNQVLMAMEEGGYIHPGTVDELKLRIRLTRGVSWVNY